MNVAKRWLPVLVWSAVLLAASSECFSTDNTGSFLRTLFGRDLPWTLHIALRKLGHLTGYGILGALWFRALRGDRGGWSLRWALGAEPEREIGRAHV